MGVDEAVSREVPLRLVEVIPQQAEPALLASVGNVRMEVEYAETALRIAAAAVAADRKLVKVETAVLQGDPAAVLLAESRDAAMVCIGSTASDASRGYYSVPLSPNSPKPRIARSPSFGPGSTGRSPTSI